MAQGGMTKNQDREETLAMKFRKSFIPIKNDAKFQDIIKQKNITLHNLWSGGNIENRKVPIDQIIFSHDSSVSKQPEFFYTDDYMSDYLPEAQRAFDQKLFLQIQQQTVQGMDHYNLAQDDYLEIQQANTKIAQFEEKIKKIKAGL